MRALTKDLIISAYEHYGEVVSTTLLNGDYRTGNKASVELFRIRKRLEKQTVLAIETLPLLFNHDNICTRSAAAIDCLYLKICFDQAVDVLMDIVASNKTVLSMDAQIALKILAGEYPAAP